MTHVQALTTVALCSSLGGNASVRFEWVKIYTNRFNGGRVESFDASAYFGPYDTDSNSTGFNSLQGRSISVNPQEGLHWFKLESDRLHPSMDTPNIGLRSFTRAGACWQEFKGPVFIMKATEDQECELTHLDMDMRGVRNAADFRSLTYRNGMDQDHLRDQRILGSVIACKGRVQQGKPKWDDVVLNGADKIWNADGATFSNLLGLPIFVRSTHNPFDVNAKPGYDNPEVTLLYRDVNSTSILPHVSPVPKVMRLDDLNDLALWKRRFYAGVTGFGSSLQKFSINTTGTCYVVRADEKSLPKEHTEALCAYIADKVEPQLTAATAGLSPNDTVTQRDQILESICKNSFLAYFDAMKQTKIQQGESGWRDLPNPYEIKHADMQPRLAATIQAQQASGFEQQSDTHLRQQTMNFTASDLAAWRQSWGVEDPPF